MTGRAKGSAAAAAGDGQGTWLIAGARPLGGDPADILLSDGVIADIGSRGGIAGIAGRGDIGGRDDDGAEAGARWLDADGLIVLPGLVDLHAHLREPGREDAETVASGTAAAALGGYTAVHAMANTDPVADTAGVVEQIWRLGQQAGRCDVQPVGAVTIGLAGSRLAELGAMADSAARVRIFSDDGRCVSDAVLMRRALEYVKAFDGVIAQHAQEPRLTEGAQVNEGEISGRLGLAGWPAVAEEAIIARDCLLAAHVGSALHVCHVSTAGSVEIIRWAKAKGWRVTAEVTPHHLLLTDELAASYDPVFKVNPPLRTAADVAALREGLADGTIDCVATDHAPHPMEDKETEWAAAGFGMTGLETALRVVHLAMVETGLLDWAGVADRMAARPAAIGRLDGRGASRPGASMPGAAMGGAAMDGAAIRGAGLNGIGRQGCPLVPGSPANLLLYDPAPREPVDPSVHASKSRNTPFAGMVLPGRVVATFLRGRPTVLDGKLAR
jgi:dihydroorotase